MASAAEQIASSISLANFRKATELKKRLWFTIGALILFRLLSFVPVPGIDPRGDGRALPNQSGGILDVFNTFSGGACALLDRRAGRHALHHRVDRRSARRHALRPVAGA
jgi:hypothetical protein